MVDTTETTNNWRRVRHGLFTYWEAEPTISPDGQEVDRLVEKMAFQGAVINVPRDYDLKRGEQFGAFTDERFDDEGQPLSVSGAEDEGAEGTDEVDLDELDDSELVEWLTATGMFDGEKRPNVNEVVAAGDGNPELAKRLLAAEATASGDQPREGVVKGLQAVAAQE
jgi:hypothetical protein